MNTSNNVVRLRQPDEIDDPLTDVLRAGARRLLAQAVELEAEAFLAGMRELKLPDGRDRLVRHGHGPEREIQTGIGPVAVSRVKIRDRGAVGGADRVRFSSSILPRWARRTRSLDALLPVLYLRGVSTGDFQEALAALLGKEAPNCRFGDRPADGEWQASTSAGSAAISRPGGTSISGRTASTSRHGWRMRRLACSSSSGRLRRGEGTRRLPGGGAGKRPELARAAGRGETARAHHRARTRGWRRGARLLDGARRDLPRHAPPALLGAQDRHVINKGPKSGQISEADMRESTVAGTARRPRGDRVLPRSTARTAKAAEWLQGPGCLAFYDSPAEHWDHLRTSNPIESVFATVRHRTVRTKGSLSPITARLMVFKLVMAASKTWRRLKGENQLPKLLAGAIFRDGTEVIERPSTRAA